MFTVSGTLDGVGYRVGIHPEGVDDPQALGVAMGSDNVLTLIDLYKGQQVQASPTSEAVTVDENDASTILALLYAQTKVDSIDGDVEPVADVLPQYGPEVVY